ncbi:hypothetical protein SCLCIDRAFT_441620 [Scleroderma citrinum Foug A]|uniref:Uncharacterized protein n=1 Tax=Scleroderma citrinum Foug A TaxID=1036808 RepID=A0A0C3AL19_9AGAM|nr:hypothetical protein SCLCIDRAFT_441620 [Scleroderma citrinum Foug A]
MFCYFSMAPVNQLYPCCPMRRRYKGVESEMVFHAGCHSAVTSGTWLSMHSLRQIFSTILGVIHLWAKPLKIRSATVRERIIGDASIIIRTFSTHLYERLITVSDGTC